MATIIQEMLGRLEVAGGETDYVYRCVEREHDNTCVYALFLPGLFPDIEYVWHTCPNCRGREAWEIRTIEGQLLIEVGDETVAEINKVIHKILSDPNIVVLEAELTG